MTDVNNHDRRQSFVAIIGLIVSGDWEEVSAVISEFLSGEDRALAKELYALAFFLNLNEFLTKELQEIQRLFIERHGEAPKASKEMMEKVRHDLEDGVIQETKDEV